MAEEIDLAGLLKRLLSDYGTTKTERKKRLKAGETQLSEIVKAYQPGGDVTKQVTNAAVTSAQSSFAGLGGPSPTTVSTPFAATIRRMQTMGQVKALQNRAQFQSSFKEISPSPSSLVNLATGGFAGLTREKLATAPGGILGGPTTATDLMDYYGLG